jgi:hypothetical protein
MNLQLGKYTIPAARKIHNTTTETGKFLPEAESDKTTGL